MDWWTGVNSCGGPAGSSAAGAMAEMNQIEPGGIFDPWIHCDDLDLGTILHQAQPGAPAGTGGAHSLAAGSITSSSSSSSSSSTSTSMSSSSAAAAAVASAVAAAAQLNNSRQSMNHNRTTGCSNQNSAMNQQQQQLATENVTPISSTQCSSTSTSGSITSLESSPTQSAGNSALGGNGGSACLKANQVYYLSNSPASSSTIFVQTPGSPILVQTSSLLVHDESNQQPPAPPQHYADHLNQQHQLVASPSNHLLQHNHQHHLSQQQPASNLHYQQQQQSQLAANQHQHHLLQHQHQHQHQGSRLGLAHNAAYQLPQVSECADQLPLEQRTPSSLHQQLQSSMSGNCEQLLNDSKANLRNFLNLATGSSTLSCQNNSRRSSFEQAFEQALDQSSSQEAPSYQQIISIEDSRASRLVCQLEHQQQASASAKQSLAQAQQPTSGGAALLGQQHQQMLLSEQTGRGGSNKKASSAYQSAARATSKTNSAGQPVSKIRRCRNITDFVLGEEERRLLIKEGYEDFPMNCQNGPLTKTEERILRKIRRKIRNKKSAQCSRQRKKEYVEELERKYASVFRENQELRKILDQIQRQLPGSSSLSPPPLQTTTNLANTIKWEFEQSSPTSIPSN